MATATTNLPTLTPEQRAAALEKAAHARKFRLQLKNDIGSRTVSLVDLINGKTKGYSEADVEVINKTKVFDLVKAVRGVGTVGAKQLIADCSVNEGRRLGGLGKRQREALTKALSDK